MENTANFLRTRRTRVQFTFTGNEYDLGVTDPKIEEELARLDIGDSEATSPTRGQRLVFTISLGEPFKANCFKFVAGVFAIPRT